MYLNNGLLIPDYIVSNNRHSSLPKTFEDVSYFLIKPDKVGNTIVETKDGPIIINTIEDLFKLFKSTWNITFSRFGEFNCLLKVIPKPLLQSLLKLKSIDLGFNQLYYIPKTNKIRMTENHRNKNSKYIWNIEPYLNISVEIDSIDSLKRVAEASVIPFNKILPINSTSPASTSKDLALKWDTREFRLIEKCPLKETQYLHSGYIGPRMETKILGTLENRNNIDKEKAYLVSLSKIPSIAVSNILRVTKDKTFYRDSHPGSTYTIEVTVPNIFKDFAPLPFRDNGYVYYPTGTFKTTLSKPYIVLCEDLGLKYKILESTQIIMRDSKILPWGDFYKVIKSVEDWALVNLPLLNVKALLHYALIGHFLSYHEKVILEPEIDLIHETGSAFNPILANAIQGEVACSIFRETLTQEADAIRVDALTGKNLNSKEGFKLSPPGLMTFLTPFFKDKPGSSIYRDLIKRDRDKEGVSITVPFRVGLDAAWSNYSSIGSLQTLRFTIPPNKGSRVGTTPNKVGSLLDSTFPLTIPSIEEKRTIKTEEAPIWLEKYLHYFPQKKT